MNVTTEPRTEAERMVVHEAGGLNPLALRLILLMRATDLTSYQAVAMIRAIRWAAKDDTVPDEYIGNMYRADLREMLHAE